MASGRGFYEYPPGEAEAWEKKVRAFTWDIRALADKYDPVKKPGETK